MIDLHSHILPAVDDGSPSLDVSLDMLDAAAAIGIRTIVATPHLTRRLEPDYDRLVRAAFAQLAPLASERGIALVPGFEIRLTPDTPSRLRGGERATLDGANVALIDLPFTAWPHYADDTLFNVQTSGFQPILAHPERYPDIQQDPAMARGLVERGIVLQVTIGSFSGAFGKRAKRAAEALLRLGAVHVLATDAHSAGHRMAAVPGGLRRVAELVGREELHRMTVEAPAMLLNGDDLPRPVPAQAPSGIRRVFAGIGF